MERKPILVTGSHRSGSTWVGRMLSAAPGVVYIHEPFNIGRYRPGLCNLRFEHWFTYITSENEQRFYRPLRRTVHLRYGLFAALREVRHVRELKAEIAAYCRFLRDRWAGRCALVKDPIAVLSAEWMVSRFDMRAVVLIRHPAAFASSLKRKDWTHPFKHFLQQPLLMRDHLRPFQAQIVQYAKHPPGVVDQACLLWRIIYHVVRKYRASHDEWIFLRHEDVSREPLRYYRRLYDALNLEWSPRIESIVQEYSEPANPCDPGDSDDTLKRNSKENIWSWKRRLSASEVLRIRDQVSDVADAFYTDEDW